MNRNVQGIARVQSLLVGVSEGMLVIQKVGSSSSVPRFLVQPRVGFVGQDQRAQRHQTPHRDRKQEPDSDVFFEERFQRNEEPINGKGEKQVFDVQLFPTFIG